MAHPTCEILVIEAQWNTHVLVFLEHKNNIKEHKAHQKFIAVV